MTIIKTIARASASALAIAAVMPAFAQSTGSQEFEHPQIIVTGAQTRNGVDGVVVPETTKSREVLTQAFIQHQVPGQSIDDIINYMPGVSFQNNDPYGASGGTLSIHGFDASRIAQTWDGMPLNDTGNYAIYSNQQLDMELISEVNVSLGSTDVDSPTAAATGSTVNYITRNPTENFHARLEGSFGQWDYMRMFGVIDTGDFTKYGTRAFISASHQNNVNPFNHDANIDKTQYNAKLYQPIGTNGDFISIAGNYNVNHNNNFSSVPLRVDTTIRNSSGVVTGARVVGSGSSNRFPITTDERQYSNGHCTTAAAVTGKADTPNSCGTAYDYSYNPSNTGNIRVNSRFTLAQGLVLNLDPSYQFVKANGGNGSVQGYEGTYGLKQTINGKAVTTPIYGYIGGKPYFGGVDLNGDGDTLDSVELYAPSHTETHRYGLIADLRYDLTPTQSVRVDYTLDYGRHRQTGEVGRLQPNGEAVTYFPIDTPLLDASGKPIEKRNRLSKAILNQASGEYRGEFLDSRLLIDVGVRAPFFKRDLTNYCVTESGGNGYVDCFNDPVSQAAFLATNTTYALPQHRVLNYSKVLPSAGFTYNFTPAASVFFSYSEGLQVPGTDNLYNSFAFAATSDAAHPKPETTDNFEGGVRYKSRQVQASLSGWYTIYKNRLASSYDPVQDLTVYRNLGTVHKYGVDGSVAYQPVPELSLYVFGSYLKSEIQGNVETGTCSAANVTAHASAGIGTCTTAGQPIYALTAGKREGGSPTYTLGGRIQGNFGPLELAMEAKRTGPRYINDQNLPVYQTYTSGGVVTQYQVYGARTPAYTVVDLDARVSLERLGLNKETYLQLNIINLFDELYVAGFGSNTSNLSIPYAYIGAPRTISGTINFAF